VTADRPRDVPGGIGWLTDRLADQLGRRPTDPDASFVDLGVSSLEAIGLARTLGNALERRLPQTVFYDYPTIRRLAGYLFGAAPDTGSARDTGSAPGTAPDNGAGIEPVAVVGIGCRLPGGIDSPAALWRLLRGGGQAVGTVPTGRWPGAGAGGPALRFGGYLDGIEDFDAAFFDISPRELAGMDPQQRLLLEVAWAALEDAGVRPSRLRGSRTGVFVGITNSDYQVIRLAGDPDDMDGYTYTGVNHSIAANRVSYLFDLNGPSIAVDTACSASLVAVHLACVSIRAGESHLALAGGTNAILSDAVTHIFARAGVLSPDGRCKTFDAAADGYVRAEGAAVLALKSLSRARADGDRVYAVILGSAVNNDGRTNGLLAPSRLAQERVLRDACRGAGVDPTSVSYVEGHGTGTQVGDLIELGALSAVYGGGRPVDRPCLVGSVKTNLGHLEAAAGVTGLTKVVLALAHGAVPPSLHAAQPTPEVEWDSCGLRVARDLTPLPVTPAPTAGVSSFGFGGSNAHVLVRAAEPVPATPSGTDDEPGRPFLLPLSARSPAALRALARRWQAFATEEPSVPLADLCYTASCRRDHHEYRVGLVAADTSELAAAIDRRLTGEVAPCGTEHDIAFVFGPVDEVWPELDDAVLADPALRPVLERCDDLLRVYADWSLLEADGPLVAGVPAHAVPAVQLSIQLALAQALRGYGVEPSAVIGYGLGELAAAHVAGALTLRDTIRVACARGRTLVPVAASGNGAPAGDPPADPPADLADALADIRPTVARLLIISGATGARLDGRQLTGRYWARPAAATHPVPPPPEHVLLHVGGGPAVPAGPPLAGAATSAVLPTLRSGEPPRRVLLATLASLYERGRDLAWPAMYAGPRPHRSLPPYPYDRETRPLNRPGGPATGAVRETASGGTTPRRLSSPALGDRAAWELECSVDTVSWLVLAAWRAADGASTAGLRDVTVMPSPSPSTEAGRLPVQVMVTPEVNDAVIEGYCRVGADADGRWSRRLTARTGPVSPEPAATPLRELVNRLPRRDSGATPFRRLWCDDRELLAFGLSAQAPTVPVEDGWLPGAFAGCLALLDLAGVEAGDGPGGWHIDRVTMRRSAETAAWVYARLRVPADEPVADVTVLGPSGAELLRLHAVQRLTNR